MRCVHGFVKGLCVDPKCQHWDGLLSDDDGEPAEDIVGFAPGFRCPCGNPVSHLRARVGRPWCSARCRNMVDTGARDM
jgi:hypothetical protein